MFPVLQFTLQLVSFLALLVGVWAADWPGSGHAHAGSGSPRDASSTDPGLAPEHDAPLLRSRTRVQRRSGPMAPEDGAAEEIELGGELDHLQGVEDVLQGRRGVQIRRTGAPGEAAYLSMRGAGAHHVRVHLDGVPLHGGAQRAYNLALLPMPLLGSVRVYRTGAPLALGPPLPGGAIDLRSRFDTQDGWNAGAEAGSMPSARLSLAAQRGGTSRRTLLALTGLLSSGQYRYFDDGGTPLFPGDDHPDRLRTNNDLRDVGLLARHMERLGDWRLTGVALAQAREHGIPGLGTLRAEHTRLATQAIRGQVLAERHGLTRGMFDVSLLGAAGRTATQFRDPELEVSLERTTYHQVTADALLRGQVTAWPTNALHLPLSTDVHLETRRAGETRPKSPDERGQRVQVGSSLEPELRLFEERLRLRIGGRVDHLSSVGRLADAQDQDAALTLFSWQGRVAFHQPIFEHASVQGYAGWASARRPPSFDELFGDGGWRVGTPDLRPETRTTASAGLGVSHVLLGADLRWSWDVWAGDASDLILWVHNAQGVARSRNVGRARYLGHEFEVAAENIGPFSSRAYLTLTDALQRSSDPALHRRRLPGEPPERGGLESWWRLGPWKVQHEWSFSSVFFADEANRRPLPARREHHLALRWSAGPWAASLSVRNLTDARTRAVAWRDGDETQRVPQPVSDTLGYPLPGRLVFAQLRFGGGESHLEAPP